MDETAAISSDTLTESDDTIQMVGFVLAGELFGVDILMVREIIKQIPVTAIPDAPDFIKGVINLRGNIIPIIDLHQRLNIAGSGKEGETQSWTLILDIGGRVTGFLVDHVTRVMKIPRSAIQLPPEMVVSAMKSHYISGICKLEAQVMAILDFNRILVVDEFKKMGALKRQENK
jgi:purine-binding chemotaxis protein CheW